MKVTVSVSRKFGTPNYGSEGATCQVEVDAPDDNPAPVITFAYALCDQAVKEQLGRHPAICADPQLPRQPAGGSWDDRHPNQRREPDSRGYDSRPRDGRQLYAWSKRAEEDGRAPGLVGRLNSFGKALGYPSRMNEWSGPQVDAALAAVLPDDQGEPAAPASRNGYR
jgi:hypothetical protein